MRKKYESRFVERSKVSTQYEVEEIIKKVLLHYYEDMSESDGLYPYDASEALKEVPYKSSSGFIPFTDGGFKITGFINLGYMESSGYMPSPKKVEAKVEEFIDYEREMAKERFIDDNSEIVAELGEDKINYLDLHEAGYEDEADELSEMEYENMSDETSSFMFELGVFYYEKGNTHGNFADEADSVYVYGRINWEAPYYRGGDNNEWVAKNSSDIKIDPNSKTFKKQLTDKIRKIVAEF